MQRALRGATIFTLWMGQQFVCVFFKPLTSGYQKLSIPNFRVISRFAFFSFFCYLGLFITFISRQDGRGSDSGPEASLCELCMVTLCLRVHVCMDGSISNEHVNESVAGCTKGPLCEHESHCGFSSDVHRRSLGFPLSNAVTPSSTSALFATK